MVDGTLVYTEQVSKRVSKAKEHLVDRAESTYEGVQV